MNDRRLELSMELLKRLKCECKKGSNICYSCNRVGMLFRELDNEGYIVDAKETKK